MKTKTIRVYNLFKTDTLRNRSTADKLVEELPDISQNEAITIDFENILFASRSFCHELLSRIKNRKSVCLVNTNNEVKKMFDVATTKPEIILTFSEEKNILA